VVPGISAALAVPAYAGIPVTHRGCASSFAVITGHDISDSAINWSGLVRSVDTLVILMGLSNLAAIMNRLVENGCEWVRPVALIQSGTRSRQVVVSGTVGTIATLAQQARLKSPVTIVVGSVVELTEQLDWYHGAVSPVLEDRKFTRLATDVRWSHP